MFFIKSCTQSFITPRYRFYKLLLINENKNKEYLNNDYTHVTKFMKIRHITGRKHKKAQKDKRTTFPKESVENPDMFKSVLNKIMTVHE